MRQQRKDVDITFELYSEEGTPTSGSVQLFTRGGSEFTGALVASIDDLDATLDSEVFASSRELEVTVATGSFVKGRSYLLGIEEIPVKVLAVDGTRVILDQGLPDNFPAGAPVKGWRMAATLPAASNTTHRRGLEVFWSYLDSAGAARSASDTLDIVRRPFSVAVTETDVEQYDHTWGEHTDTTRRWRSLIDGAHNRVSNLLRAQGVWPDRASRFPEAKDAVIHSVLCLYYATTSEDEEDRERSKYHCRLAETSVRTIASILPHDDDDEYEPEDYFNGDDELEDVLFLKVV